MRHYLALLLFALFPTVGLAKSGPSVYVCAHPDDCLLFMSPDLYEDTVSGTEKVVVIYLTSGDAGLPFSKDKTSTPAPYPYIRELASIDATEWMADIDKDPIQSKQQTQIVTVHGHSIERVSYANTASYFLRLPDGNMYGDGFERYAGQSLRKFKNGEIKSIRPIDGSAPYTSWQDFVSTLSGILSLETGGQTEVTLHVSEPDVALNYNDHTDHTTGASGMMEALQQTVRAEAKAGRCYYVYKHIDYSIAEKPVNLDGIGLQNKAGSFAVLTATQRHFLTAHNWDKAHVSYLTRNYYTTEVLPEGCGKTE